MQELHLLVWNRVSKRTPEVLLVLSLLACALLLQGCSAVPQSTAAPTQAPARAQRITLPSASVGSSYQQILSCSGPQQWVHLTAGELPPSLTLNPASATISGVPTTAGTFAFTIARIVGPRTMTKLCGYTLTVNGSGQVISVQVSPSSTSFVAGAKVQFYANVKGTSNTAVTWTASAGSISKTGLWTAPPGSSTSHVSITASSAADPSAKSSAVATIGNSQFKILTSSIPSGATGRPYSASLAASGGQAPYRWNIVAGSLPAGLKFDLSTGLLTGSPTTAGTYSFKIEGSDATQQSSQRSYSLFVAKTGTSCGPPTYNCSRTDQAIVQVPAPPNVGNLTGLNTVVTDPDFGNRIVRITDANENPSTNFQNRSFMTASSGSADENIWNVDSTLLIVQDTGARGYPLSFDPSTMQASRMYVRKFPSTNGLILNRTGNWSRVNPNVLYTEDGATIQQYDFSDRVNPPAPQLVYDFASSANCLPAGFAPTWQSRGGVSADDTVFAMGYSNRGGQGTGVYAVVYKAGSGCSVLNTSTGQVSGDWGVKGTINRPERWTIHNTKISRDGNWLIIAKENCLITTCSKGPYFWQIGTTNVISCGDGGLGSGHWTEGYTHWVNNHNTPIGSQAMRLFALPSSAINITPYLPSSGMSGLMDQHLSWNNADPLDRVPFASSTWMPLSPFTGPWYNEIIGVAADGSGTIWRFAHTFITGRNQNFTITYGIGSISQDGRFFAFSSDWMSTLGSESGAKNCTTGTNCRGDVFVVELR
jgi:hypothetical protein